MADKKLNEVTKVTDMAYVPVILSDGSVGQIAKADLATVVAGVISPIAYSGWSNVDANTLTWGIQYCDSSSTNIPKSGAACMILTCGNGDRFQLAMVIGAVTEPEIYARKNGGSWSAWKQIAFR